jgi:hypothetical protein
VDFGYGYHAADVAGTMLGSSIREIQPLLRSKTKTQHVGDHKVLLLTTRGVCCCTDGTELTRSGVIGVGSLTETTPQLKAKVETAKLASSVGTTPSAEYGRTVAWRVPERGFSQSVGAVPLSASAREGPTMTVQDANELAMRIREGILQLHTTADVVPVPYIETDLFIHQLHQRLLQHPEGQAELGRSATGLLHGTTHKQLSEHFKKDQDRLDRSRLATMATEQLVHLGGIDPAAARRLKLEALGFSFSSKAGSRATPVSQG